MASYRRPLLFHQVHGKGILLESSFIASRPDGFNGGITFSSRPVMVEESVQFKILEISNTWSGSIRIGFTVNDPKSMKYRVPDHSCPDLVKIHGNWVKALPEAVNVEGTVISFHVDACGDAYYVADNKEKKFLFGGVRTSETIWAVFDIYGNTLSIELLDPNPPVSKPRNDSLIKSDLTFHPGYFRSIDLTKGKCIASKNNCLSSYSYVFTNRPLKFGEIVRLEVCTVDPSLSSLLEYGITSCDPSTIDVTLLPKRTEELFDWPEYWIVQEDVCFYKVRDIISFEMSTEGKITVLKNDTSVSGFFYVDNNQRLWLFFKLSGCVTEISISSFVESEDRSQNITKQVHDLTLSNLGNDSASTSSKNSSSNDCVVCFENPVNCVLYRCGHMCLCLDCAKQLTVSKTDFSRGECPVCRKTITDIIKVYT